MRTSSLLAFSFVLAAAGYLLLGLTTAVTLAIVTVVLAHAGSSTNWVFSTTLLQLAVPNRFLGRVFALEMGFLTLAMSLSTYATGWGLDHAHLSARQMAAILGLAFLIPGVAWLALQRWLDRSEANGRDTLISSTQIADQESAP